MWQSRHKQWKGEFFSGTSFAFAILTVEQSFTIFFIPMALFKSSGFVLKIAKIREMRHNGALPPHR